VTVAEDVTALVRAAETISLEVLVAMIEEAVMITTMIETVA